MTIYISLIFTLHIYYHLYVINIFCTHGTILVLNKNVNSCEEPNPDGVASMQGVTGLSGGQAAGGWNIDDTHDEAVAAANSSPVHGPVSADDDGGGGSDSYPEECQRTIVREDVAIGRREGRNAAAHKGV